MKVPRSAVVYTVGWLNINKDKRTCYLLEPINFCGPLKLNRNGMLDEEIPTAKVVGERQECLCYYELT